MVSRKLGAVQLMSVLEAAHALEVVHRDIKPANIMITGADRVKLADFASRTRWAMPG